MLNSQQILEEGLLILDNSKGKPAQVGYDLSLKEVKKIGPTTLPIRFDPCFRYGSSYGTVSVPSYSEPEGNIGFILKDKTLLTDYVSVEDIKIDGYEGWLLYPGIYDLTFYEGCKIPNNRVAFIKQRSSLKRNGSFIESPVFDPGFETQNMGTVLDVRETIFIEKDARVAQILFYECDPVKEVYNGSWQNDKQRDGQK